MKKYLSAASLLFAVALAGCSGDDSPATPDKPNQGNDDNQELPAPSDFTRIPLSDDTRSAVEASNDFAFNLFKAVNNDSQGIDSDGGLCISPASVFTTLSMIANGDTGVARDEMLSVLGYAGGEAGLATLNAYNSTMLSHLPTVDNRTTCEFTNSMWYDPTYLTPRTAFSSTLEQTFKAAIKDVDPNGVEGMKRINTFVEEATKGNIRNFLTEPLGVAAAFLNTAYFKGIWASKFDKSLTAEGQFLAADGSHSSVEFMKQEKSMTYFLNNDTQAVELSFGNGNFSMTFILPEENTPVNEFIANLDDKTLSELSAHSYRVVVDLTIPKFEVSTKAELLPHLRSLGVKEGCTTGFNNITDRPLILGLFKHAVKLTVDETGAEGAASSLGGMLNMAGPEPTDTVKLEFNRPFVYLVKERSTGAILFLGAKTK